jgi:hypothetical protein
MVDRDSFKKNFGTAVPLLRAGGLHKKVLISPLIRYAVSNCCDNEAHCTNRGTGLNTMMATGLANLETWLDDQAYLKRIRNFVVINPNNYFTSDTDGVTKSDTKAFKLLWRDGPVHMVDAGYQKLAKNILDALPEVTFSRSYSSEEKPATPGNVQHARPWQRTGGLGCKKKVLGHLSRHSCSSDNATGFGGWDQQQQRPRQRRPEAMESRGTVEG